MKLLSYSHPELRDGHVSYGLIEGDIGDETVVDLFGIAGSTSIVSLLELDALDRVRAHDFDDDRARFPLDEVTFERTMYRPGKIFCIGVNYGGRNDEYKPGEGADGDGPKKPSVFVRFPSSFVGHEQPLVRPPESPQLDYEGEIVAVIGKGGRRIDRANARDHIAGLALGNEGTIRDWVRHAKFNVTQGKNWDGSGAIGPWMTTLDEIGEFDDLHITTHVNGELRQSDSPATMAYPIEYQIEYLSTFCTLEPGDIIFTGTPTGAGARFDPPKYLVPGDTIEVHVPGLGTLRNGVRDE